MRPLLEEPPPPRRRPGIELKKREKKTREMEEAMAAISSVTEWVFSVGLMRQQIGLGFGVMEWR